MSKDIDPLEFKPACVTCEHMVEGDNGAAACDAHGCFKPTRAEQRRVDMGFYKAKE